MKVKVVIETIVVIKDKGLTPQEAEEQAIIQIQENPEKYVNRGYISAEASR